MIGHTNRDFHFFIEMWKIEIEKFKNRMMKIVCQKLRHMKPTHISFNPQNLKLESTLFFNDSFNFSLFYSTINPETIAACQILIIICLLITSKTQLSNKIFSQSRALKQILKCSFKFLTMHSHNITLSS